MGARSHRVASSAARVRVGSASWRAVRWTGAGALLAVGCASGHPSSPPAVFGGQGATVTAGKEFALPAPSADEHAGAPAAAADTGPCAEPSPMSDAALIDDFEDGDGQIFKTFERVGWWWSASDHTDQAKLSPKGQFTPERLGAADAKKDDVFAAHVHAEGQKEWGAAWGTTLRWERKGVQCPLNASRYAGVRFRAKGPGTVRVGFGVPATEPPESGGTCTTSCYDLHTKVVYLSDHWDDYVVRWTSLEQGGWGTEARFDPSRLVNLSMSVHPNDLPADYWIDDLTFVSQEELDAAAGRPSAPSPAPSPPKASGHTSVPAPSPAKSR